MGKDEIHDYRGFRIEPCDGPESGRWRLMILDTSSREWVERYSRPRFDTVGDAREYIDMENEDGERCGWHMEREALEDFDLALYRTGSRDEALREAGDLYGFAPHEMSMLLEEREQPGLRPRRSKPIWYPIASTLTVCKGPADRRSDDAGHSA